MTSNWVPGPARTLSEVSAVAGAAAAAAAESASADAAASKVVFRLMVPSPFRVVCERESQAMRRCSAHYANAMQIGASGRRRSVRVNGLGLRRKHPHQQV